MKTASDAASSSPRLQPPGAGLPLAQRLVLRLWFKPFVSKRTPPAQCRETYERTTRKLIDAASAVPAGRRDTKVLVDPIRGLEDSSRHWSVNETLEHLMIVSRAIEAAILSLAAGVVPDTKIDVAKAKPAPAKPGTADEDRLAQFTAYAPGLMQRIDERLAERGLSLDSRASLRHPWFGQLTARQWYWLLSGHQGIHYAQLKQIAKGLSAAA